MALAPTPQQLVQTHIQIGDTAVAVERADTETLREQGLSGRASLPEGQALLFVFDTDGMWGIWMKDMKFPLDIVWADSSGKITTIYRSVSPYTYPKVFYPAALTRYVVELPAGFAAAHGVATGTTILNLQNKK